MKAALLALAVVAAQPAAHEESTQWIMGTALRVSTPDGAEARVVAAAFDAARALEDRLSTWRDDTPLARFNAAPAGPVDVDPSLRKYLERAREDHARTNGVFDPSVGTLRVDPGAPIGMDLLHFASSQVVRPHAAFAVDPGGDGKGLAVDDVSARLRAAGVESFVVDFGGSSWAVAGPERRVALRHGDAIVGTIVVRDRALSISSTVQVDVGEDGQIERRHHLIDPRTRESVTVDRTVAVLAPTALEAEVVSTALAIDGPERAAAWLDRFDAIEIVVVEGDRISRAGPSFAPAP